MCDILSYHIILYCIILYYIVSSTQSNPFPQSYLSNNSRITRSRIVTPSSEVLLPTIACVSEMESEMEGFKRKKQMAEAEIEANKTKRGK